jgi:hypothetical protein
LNDARLKLEAEAMKNLTAARDAVGSEEPIAAGGWCFCGIVKSLNELNGAEALASFNLFNQSLI